MQASDHEGNLYAVRYRDVAHRNLKQTHSEIVWVNALHDAGMPVTQFLATNTGKLTQPYAAGCIDVSQWLHGGNFATDGRPIGRQQQLALFFATGKSLAMIHAQADRWKPPSWFQRSAWDVEGLLGAEPNWNRFWENPALTDPQRRLVQRTREKALASLNLHGPTLDYGLIHADVIRSNVIIAGDKAQIIDFDDCGHGYRLYDIACVLVALDNEPYARARFDAFVTGYRSVRVLSLDLLPLFLSVRTLVHLGWLMGPNYDPVQQRQCVRKVIKYCTRYLNEQPTVNAATA